MNEVNENTVTYALSDDRGILSLIETIRNGIKYLSFNRIAVNSPFSLQDWSKFLHLSERTMQRYKKEEKNFDMVQSEKIIEIVMLYNKGKEVFGDKGKLDTWIETGNIALGGVAPKSFLDSSLGIQLVKDELIRIEHGILA
jgi:putative toxin-antitoxin system antitoxin component (TIGR02293 family)